MRITLDATALLGPRTGIGRYVEHLLAELPAALRRSGTTPDVAVTTWTARGGRLRDLPPGIRQVGPRMPARLLRECWRRGDHPRIELLTGPTAVFHGTNFVTPPTRHAREVVTVHDLTYERHAATVSTASLLYRELVPRAIARGAHVLTPSDAVAAAVLDHYGLAEDRVTTTTLGVDEDWFDVPAASSSWLSGRGLPSQYVLFVGSIDPRKNLPRLLAAHAGLRAGSPDAPDLVLAGPAGRETGLAATPGVHLTGWLSDPELRSLVAGARAVALPSLDEGFGLPALEALAAGRPVLAADIAVLHEVVGPTGTYTDPLDVDAITDGLARVLDVEDDDTARESRRDRARTFTWARTADQTVAAYRVAAG